MYSTEISFYKTYTMVWPFYIIYKANNPKYIKITNYFDNLAANNVYCIS